MRSRHTRSRNFAQFSLGGLSRISRGDIDGLREKSWGRVSNLTGNLQCRRGVGGYTYTDADRVLWLNWNYDAYEVNEGGGPTIDTINMLGSQTGGTVPTDQNRFCGATVKLRVAQPFTLGNAGNIVAASGQRAIGTVVTLQYFPSAAKWHEV